MQSISIWKPTPSKEGFELVFVVQKLVLMLLFTLHRTVMGEKISIYIIMKIFLLLEGRRDYLLDSDIEISCFKSKLLEILENLSQM